MQAPEKVQENWARRKLARMGYALSKSRRRDVDALDYGLYAIIDPETRGLVSRAAPWGGYALTLNEVCEWIAHAVK